MVYLDAAMDVLSDGSLRYVWGHFDFPPCHAGTWRTGIGATNFNRWLGEISDPNVFYSRKLSVTTQRMMGFRIYHEMARKKR